MTSSFGTGNSNTSPEEAKAQHAAVPVPHGVTEKVPIQAGQSITVQKIRGEKPDGTKVVTYAAVSGSTLHAHGPDAGTLAKFAARRGAQVTVHPNAL